MLRDVEIAAIIGYWRCSGNIYEIAGLTDVEPAMIEIIIENYQNKLTKNDRTNNRIIQQHIEG